MCVQNRGDCTVTYEKTAGKTCPTEILEKLAEANAEGRPIWKPRHMQPIYRENPFITKDGDGRRSGIHDAGADIFARGLCLPSDNKMTEEEQSRVIAIVRSCFA